MGGSRPVPQTACCMAKPAMSFAGRLTMILVVKSHSAPLDGMCMGLEVALEAKSHTG